jgi:site-specific recombinase XerC
MPNQKFSDHQLWFSPAQLYTGKEWYVGYKVENPATGERVRKRIKLNRIQNLAERRKYAKRLIDNINRKLYDGWNPFLEDLANRGYDRLVDAADVFLRIKIKELSSNSTRSYKSFVKALKDWLKLRDLEKLACIEFGKPHATDFCRWLYDERNLSNKTFNNYITFCRLFWEWLIEGDFATLNPFKEIKKKVKKAKERIVIDPQSRAKIENYFKENDFNMYVVCMLVYHSLIRPAEIVQLKPKHFSLKNQTITVTAVMSKTNNHRVSTIPNVMLRELLEWDFNGAGTDEFIFGSKFQAGDEPVNPRRLSKKWAAMFTK